MLLLPALLFACFPMALPGILPLHRHSESSAQNLSPLEQMEQDVHLIRCAGPAPAPEGSVFVSDPRFAVCNVPALKPDAPISDQVSGMSFVCFAVYDLALKWCDKLPLSKLTALLDSRDSPPTENEVCASNGGLLRSALQVDSDYNQSQPYVKTLREAFADDTKCQQICYNYFHVLEPMCKLILLGNSALAAYAEPKTLVKDDHVVVPAKSPVVASHPPAVSSAAAVPPKPVVDQIPVVDSPIVVAPKKVEAAPKPLPKELKAETKTQPISVPAVKEVAHAPEPPVQKIEKIDDHVKSELPVQSEVKQGIANDKSKPSDDSNMENSENEFSYANGGQSPNDNRDEKNSPNLDEKTSKALDITDQHRKDGDYDDTFENPDEIDGPPPNAASDKDTSQLKQFSVPDQHEIVENSKKISEKATDLYHSGAQFNDAEDSNFFTYFFFAIGIFILGYVIFHNKNKVLGLLVEGRRANNTNRRRGVGSSAAYRKLDCTLEEAVSSTPPSHGPNIVY